MAKKRRKTPTKRAARTKRFVIQQNCPTWVETFYAVEAKNADDAREKVNDDDCEYLGFTLGDRVFSDSEIVSVEQMDEGEPYMRHHANESDPREVTALIEAARALLVSAIDMGEAMPDSERVANECPEDPYPRDDQGVPWYADYLALYKALLPFKAMTENESCGT